MDLQHITYFFNQRIYKVPNYQRGYSWQKEHVEDLLVDISHAIKLKTDHYMGTITIQYQDQEDVGLNQFDVFDIVDGQQRFTTIIILLKVLVNKLSTYSDLKTEVKEKEKKYLKKNDAYLFRYEVDDINDKYFRSETLDYESTSSNKRNIYTDNLRIAKETVESFFEDKSKEECLRYLKVIEEKLKFNEYIVNDEEDVGIVFETINNRGIGLSTLELVKNRLLYLCTKIGNEAFDDANSERKRLIKLINQKWADILTNLTLTEKVLDEDNFLRNHWVIYFGYDKDTIAKDDILNNHFTVQELLKDRNGMKTKIKDYIQSLSEASLHWKYLNAPQHEGAFSNNISYLNKRNKIKARVLRLNRLNTASIRPLLLALSIKANDANSIIKFADLCEIFSFRVYEMNRRRSDVGQNNLYRTAHELYTNFNSNTLKSAKKEVEEIIVEYGTWSKFEAEIEDLFASDKKKGYYSWKGLEYCLFEYEDFKRDDRDPKVKYSRIDKKQSIEHIFPKNPKDNYWSKRFNFDNKKEKKRYLHSLGNLLLLDPSSNSSIGNKPYPEKKKHYSNSSYSANEIASTYDEWNTGTIKDRKEQLRSFIKRRWKFDELNPETYYQNGNGAN